MMGNLDSAFNPVTAYYVSFKNGGRSPAFNADIAFSGTIEVCPRNQKPATERCVGDKCAFHNLEMLPDFAVTLRVPPFGTPLPPRSDICVVALIDYRDAGGPHKKHAVCLTFGPFGERTCLNYAD